MLRLSTILAAAALFACGCATNQIEPLELEPVPEFELAYTGEVGRDGPRDLPQYTEPESNTDFFHHLEVRILRGSAAEAEALFGPRVRHVAAWSMSTDELEAHSLKLVGSTRATSEFMPGLKVLAAPRLSVFDGQQGSIMVFNEVAYISGFDVSVVGPRLGSGVGTPGSRIANPVVETVTDGLVLGLRASAADEDHMRLSVDLTLSEVVKPIRTQQVNVLGAPVSVQMPVLYTQRLKGEGLVSGDRVLVLTGMMEGDDVFVVLISGQRINRED